MPDGSNPEVMQYYTNDFLRMTFPGQALSVYEVNGVWWNTRFKWHWLEPQAYRYLWLQELGEKRVAYQVLHTSQQLLVISLNSTLTEVGVFFNGEFGWTASEMLSIILSPLLFFF